jgi:hypothetical protein
MVDTSSKWWTQALRGGSGASAVSAEITPRPVLFVIATLMLPHSYRMLRSLAVLEAGACAVPPSVATRLALCRSYFCCYLLLNACPPPKSPGNLRRRAAFSCRFPADAAKVRPVATTPGGPRRTKPRCFARFIGHIGRRVAGAGAACFAQPAAAAADGRHERALVRSVPSARFASSAPRRIPR